MLGYQQGAQSQAIVRRLEDLVEQGCLATGIQCWLAVDDAVALDASFGQAIGTPMTSAIGHDWFCVGKVVLAIAVLRLLEAERIPLESRLRSVVADGPDVTIRELLAHRAGLDGLTAFEYRVTDPDQRTSRIQSIMKDSGPRSGYSEVLAGLVIERIIEHLTGVGPVEWIYGELLGPLGLAKEIALEPGRARRAREEGRLSVPIGGLPKTPYPLLSELLNVSLSDVRPAFGAIMTARAVGALLHTLNLQIRGHSNHPVLPSRAFLVDALTPVGDPFVDPAIRRPIQAAGFLMVDLPSNGLSSAATKSSFGHNGGVAQAVVASDPSSGTTIALYLNGASLDPRPSLLERIAILDAAFGMPDPR